MNAGLLKELFFHIMEVLNRWFLAQFTATVGYWCLGYVGYESMYL